MATKTVNLQTSLPDFDNYTEVSSIEDNDVFIAQRGGVNKAVSGALVKEKAADYWYGFRMTIGQTDSAVTAIGRDDLIASHPCSAAIYPAVIAEDQSEVYKLDQEDLTKKENGQASDLSGADGDVMIVVPDFWWTREQDGSVVDFKFSPLEQAGWTKVPKHAKGIYMSDEDTSGKMRSRSGVTPLTNKTRAYFRTIASAKGSGWCMQPYYIQNADFYLAVAEVLSLNSQEFISDGATNAASADWSAYNSSYPVWTTDGGSASDYGAGTVTATPTDPNESDIRNGVIDLLVSDFNGSTLITEMAVLWWQRDVFGHIWEFVDGLNIHNSSAAGSVAYVCEDVSAFADDTDTGYSVLGQLAEADGYISQFILGQNLPIATSGTSSQHCGDYYFTSYDTDPDGGWRVARWGGLLNYGAGAGLCCAASNYSAGLANASFGARLCLIFD